MKLKLFGKEVFNFASSKSEGLVAQSMGEIRKSKFLPDFYTMRDYNNSSSDLFWTVSTPSIAETAVISTTVGDQSYVLAKKQQAEMKKKFELTPKKVFEMKFLNKKDFKINTDPAYVDEQIETFKDKLNTIKLTEFDMSRGVNEIASIITRLENRKKYPEFKDFFENFAYTTTDRIQKIIDKHTHLKLGQIEQFIADMPKEASDAMREYSKYTQKICGKNAVFYIIANKKDFEKTQKRRDPILLAQSPFAHVWQICGAWDDEMLLLEEL